VVLPAAARPETGRKRSHNAGMLYPGSACAQSWLSRVTIVDDWIMFSHCKHLHYSVHVLISLLPRVRSVKGSDTLLSHEVERVREATDALQSAASASAIQRTQGYQLQLLHAEALRLHQNWIHRNQALLILSISLSAPRFSHVAATLCRPGSHAKKKCWSAFSGSEPFPKRQCACRF
jgi:hypothetical protein